MSPQGSWKFPFIYQNLMNKSHQVAHISLEICERDLILNNVIVNQSLGIFVNCSWLTINNFFLNYFLKLILIPFVLYECNIKTPLKLLNEGTWECSLFYPNNSCPQLINSHWSFPSLFFEFSLGLNHFNYFFDVVLTETLECFKNISMFCGMKVRLQRPVFL